MIKDSSILCVVCLMFRQHGMWCTDDEKFISDTTVGAHKEITDKAEPSNPGCTTWVKEILGAAALDINDDRERLEREREEILEPVVINSDE